MKNLLSLILVALVAFESLGQSTSVLEHQQDLMKKSDAQYKAGWIFLGTGLALSITAIAIPYKYDPNDGSNNSRVTSFLGWTGFLSISTSIPLFLSAGYNARTAAKLSLEPKALHQPNIGGELPRNIPSLTLKIPL